MKSARFSKVLLLMILSISVFSCRDRYPNTPVQPPIVAGKGGLATIHALVQHQGLFIDTGRVYVKYNAVAAPANGLYDDSARIIKDGSDYIAIFHSLTQGDYFLYAKGWDMVRSQTVIATRPYKITAETEKGVNRIVLQAYKQ